MRRETVLQEAEEQVLTSLKMRSRGKPRTNLMEVMDDPVVGASPPEVSRRLPTKRMSHAVTRLFCASTTVITSTASPRTLCPGYEANLPTRFCLESLCPLLTITANIARTTKMRPIRVSSVGGKLRIGVMHFWMSLHREYCAHQVGLPHETMTRERDLSARVQARVCSWLHLPRFT
jgi:hypothetical protein